MFNNIEEDQLINDFIDNKIQVYELYSEIIEQGLLDSNENFSSVYKNFDIPWNIANYMIELSKIDLNTTILEPAFNHGLFLLALLEHMKITYKMSPKELLSWFNNKVTGYEENPLKYETVKNLLTLYFFKIGLDINSSQLYNLFNDNFIDNKRNCSFHDLAIGSIPYSSLKDFPETEASKFKNMYPSTKGNNNEITGAYFEQTWNFSQRFCFFSSNNFLNNDNDLLSIFLLPKLTHLISFEKIISPKIFRGTSITHGFTHIKSPNCFFSNDLYKSFRVEDKELLSSTFDLNSASFNSVIFHPISSHEIFNVTQQNDKYISKWGDEVEKEICIPFVDFSTNNYLPINKIDNYVIYPYSKFSLISENKLEKIYPKTYKYLLSKENDLLERDFGKGYNYENFYAYQNQFGVSQFLPEEILIIPICFNNEIRPYYLKTLSLSESEYFFFKGAYIIDGSNEYVNNAFTGAKFANFLKEFSTPVSLNNKNTFKVHFNLIQHFLGSLF